MTCSLINEIFDGIVEMEDQVQGEPYRIAILSNIVVHQLQDILNFHILSAGIKPEIVIGSFDNIVQDSVKYKECDLVIIFWEACNLFRGFHYTVETKSKEEIEEIISLII